MKVIHPICNRRKIAMKRKRTIQNGSKKKDKKVKSETNKHMMTCLDPKEWNKAPIIDWENFYENDPDAKIPKEYDPPQRYGVGPANLSMPFTSPKFDNQMHYLVTEEDKLTKEEVSFSTKPNTAKATGNLFEKILGPSPDSSKIPKPFRNALLWMEDNHCAEEFVSLNRWAWRSNTGGDGRAIALGSNMYDWTCDSSEQGDRIASRTGYCTIQESPCKKYYKLYNGTWLTFYVIQEGDVLLDRHGKSMDVEPGDLLRLTYGDGLDPYDCAPANIVFMYLVRKVAEYDEESGTIKPVCPHYDRCIAKAKAPKPEGIEKPEYLTMQQRFDLSRLTVCDTQLYITSPTPPTGDDIEHL